MGKDREKELETIANKESHPECGKSRFELYKIFHNKKINKAENQDKAYAWLEKATVSKYIPAYMELLNHLLNIHYVLPHGLQRSGDTTEMILKLLKDGSKLEIPEMQFRLGLVYAGKPISTAKLKVKISLSEPVNLEESQKLINAALQAGLEEAMRYKANEFLEEQRKFSQEKPASAYLDKYCEIIELIEDWAHKNYHIKQILIKLYILAMNYFPEEKQNYEQKMFRCASALERYEDIKYEVNVTLGMYYYNSTARNFEKAQKFLKKAMSDEFQKEKVQAEFYLQKINLELYEKDSEEYQRAVNYFQKISAVKTCDATNYMPIVHAQMICAMLIKQDRKDGCAYPSEFGIYYAKAYSLTKKFNAPNPEISYGLSEYYFSLATPESIKTAYAYLKEAAEHHHEKAYNELRRFHQKEENNREQDAKEIVECYETLWSNEKATYAAADLAYLHLKGVIIPRNIEAAIHWYSLAQNNTEGSIQWKYLLQLAKDMLAISQCEVFDQHEEDIIGFSALEYALVKQDWNQFSNLLENEKYKNALTKNDNIDKGRIIQIALLNGIKWIHLLKDKGFTLCEKNKHKATTLHVAAEAGDLDHIEFLLKTQEELLAQDNDGDTPLHVLLAQKFITIGREMAASFLANTHDDAEILRFQNHDGNTLLHLAAIHQRQDLYMQLLEKNKSLGLIRNHKNEIPIQIFFQNDKNFSIKNKDSWLYKAIALQAKDFIENQLARAWIHLSGWDSNENLSQIQGKIAQSVNPIKIVYKKHSINIPADTLVLNKLNEVYEKFYLEVLKTLNFNDKTDDIAISIFSRCNAMLDKTQYPKKSPSDLEKPTGAPVIENSHKNIVNESHVTPITKDTESEIEKFLNSYGVSRAFFESTLALLFDENRVNNKDFLEKYFNEHGFVTKFTKKNASLINANIIAEIMNASFSGLSELTIESPAQTSKAPETTRLEIGESSVSSKLVVHSYHELIKILPSKIEVKHIHCNHKIVLEDNSYQHCLDRMNQSYQCLEKLPAIESVGNELGLAYFIHFHLLRWYVSAWILTKDTGNLEVTRDWLRHNANYLAQDYLNEMLRFRQHFLQMPLTADKVHDLNKYTAAIKKNSGHLRSLIQMPTTQSKLILPSQHADAIDEAIFMMWSIYTMHQEDDTILLSHESHHYREILLMVAERLYQLTNKAQGYDLEIANLLRRISKRLGHEITSDLQYEEQIYEGNSDYRQCRADPLPIDPLIISTGSLQRLLMLLFPVPAYENTRIKSKF